MRDKQFKPKTCKACKTKFTPERQFQVTCSWECGLEHAKNLKAKKHRADVKTFRSEDKSILRDKAQQVFNKFIRLRDKDKPCISCGYSGDKRQWHASHYMPMGNNPAIRYSEDNVHKSCSICNNHLSGNLVKYREALILKLGLEKVEWLEAQRNPYKWTIEELKEIIEIYKKKVKELEN